MDRADFRVFDDGREQTLEAFAEEQEPLDLILLFDVSGSMRSALKQVVAAGQGAFAELHSTDRVEVVTFTSEIHIVTPFTSDRDELASVLNHLSGLRFEGRTRIQDAVNDAALELLRLRKDSPRRRAVLVVTDNLAPPAHSEKRVVENLWEADCILSGIAIPNHKALAALLHDTRGAIDRMVAKTGGDVIRPADLATALPDMIHRIRTRYSLYYRLPEGEPGSLRKVRVELSQSALTRFRGVHVAAKQGYRLNLHRENGFAVR